MTVAESLAWKGAFVAALCVLAWRSFRVMPLERPVVGARGAARFRAIDGSLAFAALEPVLRQVAGWIVASGSPVPGSSLEEKLRRSGEWLGLSEVEVVALSFLVGVLGGCAGLLAASGLELSPLLALPSVGLGAAVPFLRMHDAARTREREVTRGLPGAIDLLWLCMSAGLDFPAALRFATGDDAVLGILRAELGGVLRDVELGYTRIDALRSMEGRIPFPAVRGFVAAVVQSEERGNPLAEVLRVQAEVLRTRRGVLAEEAAARASVLLVIPLMLLLGCVLLLLFGPFIVGGWI